MSRKSKVSIPEYETLEQLDRELQRMAMETAYRQLKDGSAPPSLVNYFVKRADKSEAIKTEALIADASLKRAKVSQIEQEAKNKASSEEAIKALRSYKPSEDV